MKIIPCSLAGLLLIEPHVFEDERGFFYESYNAARFAEQGLPVEWAQDNHARSVAGTLRGLHFQRPPGQAKLVRCTRGRIWDVAVDLRHASPTRGQWHATELTEENRRIFFIPAGFAHGYLTLSDVAEVQYKCTRVYDPALEDGVRWDDPQLAIAWPIAEPILSPRDRSGQDYQTWLEKVARGECKGF